MYFEDRFGPGNTWSLPDGRLCKHVEARCTLVQAPTGTLVHEVSQVYLEWYEGAPESYQLRFTTYCGRHFRERIRVLDGIRGGRVTCKRCIHQKGTQ